MAKKTDWNKARKLAEKGFSVGEIASKMKMATGTLYNNKSKWQSSKEIEITEESANIVAEVVSQSPSSTPLNNTTTTREVIEVKEFYKSTLQEIRRRITKILKDSVEEETFREIQILEKLVKIIKEIRYIDYTVNDILTYKDLASLEILATRLELDLTRMKRGVK
jgi:predicted oxidoreductase (fatty acid repression mutant protein)